MLDIYTRSYHHFFTKWDRVSTVYVANEIFITELKNEIQRILHSFHACGFLNFSKKYFQKKYIYSITHR